MPSAVNPYFLHLHTQSVLQFGNPNDDIDKVMAQHRLRKEQTPDDDVQNVLTPEQETHFMHQAQENVKREHELIQQMRRQVTGIVGDQQLTSNIDTIELEHIKSTVTWLTQLILQLNEMKQYVSEQMTQQHKSPESDIKDASFAVYNTLIKQYDNMLIKWQPVLELYEKQMQRLQERD